MRFTVEFYVSESGRVPVEEFLDELERDSPRDHAGLLKGLHRLRSRDQHREPLCKALGAGLFELRHQKDLNSRILWFFMAGRRIIAVHGIRHKAQAIPEGDLRMARQRQADWIRRHG